MKDSEWTILDDDAIRSAQEALEADRRGYGHGRHYNQRRDELIAWLEHEAPELRWMVKSAQEREADEMMGLIPKALLWNVYEINAITEPGEIRAGTEKLHGKIEIAAEHVEDVGAQEVARVIAGLVRLQVQHAKRLVSAPSAKAKSAPPYHPNARCAVLPRSALRTWMRPSRRRRRSRWRIPASLLGGFCLIAGLVGTEWGRTDDRFIDGMLILAGCAFLMYAASLRKSRR